jgi:hypothetical protein
MVRSLGSHFDFFVNGTQVGQIDDASYPTGEVGLEGSQNCEVVFTNLAITRTTA